MESKTVIKVLSIAVVPIVLALIAIVPPTLEYFKTKPPIEIVDIVETPKSKEIDNIVVSEIIYKSIEKFSYLARIVIVEAKPGTNPLNITITHEGVNFGLPRIGSSVRNMPLDPFLKRTISKLILFGVVVINVEEASGDVKAIYKAQKTKFTYIYVIKHTPEALTYIVIGFDESAPDKLPFEAKEEIRQLVNRIKQEYN